MSYVFELPRVGELVIIFPFGVVLGRLFCGFMSKESRVCSFSVHLFC